MSATTITAKVRAHARTARRWRLETGSIIAMGLCQLR